MHLYLICSLGDGNMPCFRCVKKKLDCSFKRPNKLVDKGNARDNYKEYERPRKQRMQNKIALFPSGF